jgi:5-formyltetrahydrofolate cyclo-ligase
LPGIVPESWDVTLDFIATDRELIDCRADAAGDASA